MTTAATTEAAPSRHRWLCFFLAVIATIELVDALTSIQTIFTDHANETTALRLAQTLTNIRLLLTPLIVAAALFFCAMGDVHRAILALAAFNLMVWLLDGVPTIALHDMSLSFDYGGLEATMAAWRMFSSTSLRRSPPWPPARWRSENGGPDSPASSSVSRRYSGGSASLSSSSRS